MKFPETHVLATLLAGNAWLSNGKRSYTYQVLTSYFRIFRFLEVCIAQSNGKFTLNLCDTQVFKTKKPEISC